MRSLLLNWAVMTSLMVQGLVMSALVSSVASATFRDPASIAPATVKWLSKQPSAQDPIGVSVMCATGDFSVVSVSLQNRTNKALCMSPSALVSSMSDEKKDQTFECRILPGNAHDLRQFSPMTASAISGCGGVGMRILAGDIYETKFTFDSKGTSQNLSKKYEVVIPTSCDVRNYQVTKYAFECIQ
jgi:hypothetical protein